MIGVLIWGRDFVFQCPIPINRCISILESMPEIPTYPAKGYKELTLSPIENDSCAFEFDLFVARRIVIVFSGKLAAQARNLTRVSGRAKVSKGFWLWLIFMTVFAFLFVNIMLQAKIYVVAVIVIVGIVFGIHQNATACIRAPEFLQIILEQEANPKLK